MELAARLYEGHDLLDPDGFKASADDTTTGELVMQLADEVNLLH